jgi:hypothetical protein
MYTRGNKQFLYEFTVLLFIQTMYFNEAIQNLPLQAAAYSACRKIRHFLQFIIINCSRSRHEVAIISSVGPRVSSHNCQLARAPTRNKCIR